MLKKYFFLFSLSYLIAFPLNSFAHETMNVQTQKEMQNNNHHSDGKHHHEETFNIPENDPIPTVKLMVYQDPMRGYNLEIKVTNFTFAPEKIGHNSSYNEGHGHLYLNGEKLTRIYGNWYYLGSLPKGENKITVSLNTNNHQTLVSQGNMIQDTVIINVP